MKPCLTPLLLAALLTGMAPGMVFSQKESACTIQINPAPNPVSVGQPATFGVQSAFPLDFCTWTFSPNATPQNITVPGPFPANVHAVFSLPGPAQASVLCFCLGNPEPVVGVHNFPVVQSSPPTVSVTSNKTDFCPGQTLLLFSSVSGGSAPYQYNWSGPNFPPGQSKLPNPVLPNIGTNQSGEYALTVTDNTGQTATASITIAVHQPVPKINADKIPNCAGDTVTLTVAGAYSLYQWSTGASTPAIKVAATGVYAVTVTDQYGCTGSTQRALSFPAAMQLTTSSNSPCAGDPAALSVSVTGGTPPLSYRWIDPFGTQVATTQNLNIAAAALEAAGNYTAIATDAKGCTAEKTALLQVRGKPGIAAAAEMLIGTGTPVTLAGNLHPQTPGNAVTLISVTGPNGFFSTQANPVLAGVTLAHAGVYIWEVSNAAGCTSFDTTLLRVRPDSAGIPYAPQNVLFNQEECLACDNGNDCSHGSGTSGSAIESAGSTAGRVMPPHRMIEELSGPVKTAQPNIMGPPPCECEVNAYTGNLHLQIPFFYIPSLGPDLAFTLSYNSGATARNSGYGQGWTWNYNLRWERQGNELILHRGDGRSDHFTRNGSAYLAPPGVFDTLIETVADRFKLRTKFGLEFFFENPAHGRLTRILDRNGNPLTITYTDSLATLLTDASGRTLQLRYQNGLLHEVVEDNTGEERRYSLQHDANGMLRSVTDPAGYIRQYQPDLQGHIVQISDRTFHQTAIEYTSRGAVTRLRSAIADMQIEYDTLGRETRRTELVGSATQTTRYGFDAQGRVTFTTGACCGFDVGYEYDGRNNIRLFRDAKGYEYQYEYDGLGNVVRAIDPDGYEHRYGRSPAFSHLTLFTDKNGNTTRCTKEDGRGNITEIEYPDGGIETFTWYPNGLLASRTDADGRTTGYDYDADGHRTAIRHPIGTERFAYNKTGRRTRYTSPNGHNTLYQLDIRDFTVKTTDPLGHSEEAAFDGNGNVIRMKDKRGFITVMARDAHRRMVARTQFLVAGEGPRPGQESTGGKIVTTYVYDQKNLVAMLDPKGYATRWTYNQKNQRTSEINALGFSMFWEYDPNGNVTRRTNRRGFSEESRHDAMNRDTSHTDALGCTTTHLYDGNGNNVEVEGPNGVRSKFTFDKMNRQTGAEHDSSKSSAEYSKAGDPRKRTDPNGNVTTFVFDANHRLIEEIDPYGFKITYEYDSTGNVVKITDKKGNVTCMVYDARDDEIARINAMGDSTISIRDAAGQVVATINERGFTTSFVLDALGRNTQTIFPIGQQTREYDAASNVVAEIDAEGLRTRHEYDSLHRLVRTIFADSTAVAYAYDAENNPTTFTNEENETTVTSYDARNQRASVANALGETTLFEYNCLGQLVGTVLPNGNVVRSVFDQQGRLVAQHDGMGQIFIHAFDDAGNQTEVTDANGNRMRYKPDALHRTVEITDAEGNSSAVVYDPNSNPVQTADRNGHPTFFTYDSLDRRTGLTNALGHHIRYAFDAAGNLVGITDAKGNSTTYVYDGNNRQTDEIFADGTSKKTEYNLAGVAIAFTDNMGRRTQLYHDRRYRLIRRDLPDANDDHFTYSPSGRMLTAVNADATVAFAYDPAGRLVGETLNGRTTAYEYDIPAWRRKITYPSGLVVVETADLRGRMGHISAGGAEVARWTHDSGNRILARQYANGVVSRHTHDRNNRTTSLQHANTAGVLVGFNYAFDLEDNKRYEAKIHRPELSERYGYDRIYRLDTFLRGNLTAQSFTFEELFQYDALGNREQARQNGVPTTYTANEMNEYTSISGQPAPTHDGNGNQTFDGVHTYQFDFKNMVISVDGGATARYRYDALGRRICKITAADTAYFYFAGWREIEALKGSGALGRQWVYGIYIDEMVAMLRPGLPPLFYLQNSLYSVHALADANGNLAEGYLYDAYGKVTVFGAGANGRVDFGGDDAVGSASFLGNPCLFTGRWLDGETGGYYYRMRRMDAREGRFLQRDPIGYFDELNTYTYVGNNTTNSIDPLGLFDIIEMIKKFIRTALIIGISSTSQNSEVGGLLRDMGEMFSQESPVEVEEPPNRRPRPVNPRPVNPRPPSRPPTSIPPRGPKPPTSNPLKAGGAVLIGVAIGAGITIAAHELTPLSSYEPLAPCGECRGSEDKIRIATGSSCGFLLMGRTPNAALNEALEQAKSKCKAWQNCVGPCPENTECKSFVNIISENAYQESLIGCFYARVHYSCNCGCGPGDPAIKRPSASGGGGGPKLVP